VALDVPDLLEVPEVVGVRLGVGVDVGDVLDDRLVDILGVTVGVMLIVEEVLKLYPALILGVATIDGVDVRVGLITRLLPHT